MERELRRMFRESELFYDAMFCGKMMIGKLDKDVRAKIEFYSTEVHKHYDAFKIFDIWTQAINLCIPLMGVNLLCQTYMQWNTSRKTAYFSLGCAVFVFACAIAVFFIK